MTSRRTAWAVMCVLLASLAAGAAMAGRITGDAVPFYSPEQFVQAAYRFWASPRADEFAGDASQLQRAVSNWCDSAPLPAPPDARREAAAREQFRVALVAWTRLSAVPFGPVLERRSERVIDFSPARTASIEQAIAAAPADAAAMERIGGPAKGFAGLEWLLWVQRPSPRSPGCTYMIAVAADIEREARALQQAYATLVQRDWDPDAAASAMGEILNQWIGAVERLRWSAMDKPLRAAGKKAPEYPRRASGATGAQWRAQWDAVRALAVLDRPAPAPGTALIPIEALMRGRGLNPGADALVRATRDADARMAAVDPESPHKVSVATKSLAALKRTGEARVAPALKINVGFSDADGD